MFENDQINKPVSAEILPSTRLSNYMNTASTASQFAANPSNTWAQLETSPQTRFAVFAEMEKKDGMVSSCLETRKLGVLTKNRLIAPASDKLRDRKIAAHIDELLTRFNFDEFLFEALDAIGDGMTIAEKIFTSNGREIFIEDVRFRVPYIFTFGGAENVTQSGELRLRSGSLKDQPEEVALDERYFVIFSYRKKYGNRWGNGLKMRAFWIEWLKRAGRKQWLRLLEKGNGSVVTKWNQGASQKEKELALTFAQAVYDEPVVAVPENIAVEILESVRPLGNSHEAFVEACDNELARIFLGQTLTSKGSEGGSGARSLGVVHERSLNKRDEGDCYSLEYVINKQIIEPLVRFNYGFETPAPKWQIERDAVEDLNTIAERIERLFNLGLPLSKDWLGKTFTVPTPRDGTDVLQKTANVPAANDGATAEFAEKKHRHGANLLQNNSAPPSNSKPERFERLRPSMSEFSDE